MREPFLIVNDLKPDIVIITEIIAINDNLMDIDWTSKFIGMTTEEMWIYSNALAEKERSSVYGRNIKKQVTNGTMYERQMKKTN